MPLVNRTRQRRHLSLPLANPAVCPPHLKIVGESDILIVYAGRLDATVLLAHTRRWKHDARFFKLLKKLYTIEDITAHISPEAAQYHSHSMGQARLFHMTRAQSLSRQ